MRLDPAYLDFISKDEIRLLTSLELGQRNHEWVPMSLIEKISHTKRAQAFRIIKNLLKHKLVVHTGLKYDGYRLSALGFDYLALNVLRKRGSIKTIEKKIGVGKESDIYLCTDINNNVVVLKLARLGRTSFRTIKINRDYLQNKTHYNWLYLSKIASLKEYFFMQALH
jgi:RIO kinase 2